MGMTTAALSSEPTTSGVMVDIEDLKKAAESDRVAATAYDLIKDGIELDERRNFKIYEDEVPIVTALTDEILEVPGVKEAIAVHDDTRASTQRRIDEWFGSADFGAVIVNEIVNNHALDPYDRGKHLEMLKELGKITVDAAKQKAAYDRAMGRQRLAEFAVRDYEERYEADIIRERAMNSGGYPL